MINFPFNLNEALERKCEHCSKRIFFKGMTKKYRQFVRNSDENILYKFMILIIS
jgi:hypothetical protein